MPTGSPDPTTWLRLPRTVRFGDTDAAGVMHFHQLLRWCHEAYEESLERFGIAPATVFPTPCTQPAVALPITHCRADFHRPLICGDALLITLEPQRVDHGSFSVSFRFQRTAAEREEVARGLTRHRAIEAASRRPCNLPPALERWLEESGSDGWPTPEPGFRD